MMATQTLTIAGQQFAWGTRTYIMAIVNVTPDSFSGDGIAQAPDSVAAGLAQAQRAAAEGADIIDVGGESTRPGAQPVTLQEEQDRVVPLIAALAQTVPLPISIDSYHATTVAAALDAGAHMVNDVWGLRTATGGWNEALADLVAQRGVPLVLMNNRRWQAGTGSEGDHDTARDSAELVREISAELAQSIAYAESRGIRRDRLIIDPGIGFGKTPAQNLQLLRGLSALRSLQLPLLVGASRKAFIGQALGLPPDQRDEGTAAVSVFAIERGADMLRVHNVLINARAARMADVLVRE